MIINKFIITYLLLSFVSLVLSLGAVVTGVRTRKIWGAVRLGNDQDELEKNVYLIISLVGLGFLIRLILVPLWFFTLQSMIPSVPGAMCLFGVHQIGSPLAWIATGFKIFLPFAYGFWLVLNHLDRKIISQPFMKAKLIALFPLGLIMLTDALLDLNFLFTVPPRQVSCCTSFFDLPTDAIPQIFTHSSWVWVRTWYLLTLVIGGEAGLLVFLKKKGLTGRVATLLESRIFTTLVLFPIAVAGIIIFFLALHTKISPLFLHLPFHHCIFCLWQGVWDAPLFTVLILFGFWAYLTYLGITFLKKYEEIRQQIENSMISLLIWSGSCLLLGLIIVSIHLILV